MGATLPLSPAASRDGARPRGLAHTARLVAALMAADLRQRTRSTRFRVVALAIALSTWWCLPPADAGYLVVAIGDHHRGDYSSAWIGMVLAMLSLLWGLVGFYLVRGTVQRDFETRVWQLLASTSMRRGSYLLAKWGAHLVVMGALLGASLLVGLVAQWVRAEDRHIDLWELVKPSLFIALPTLAMSATLAVWFDVVPVLRRTAGNVVFFFVWMAVLTTGAIEVAHHRQVAGTAAVQPWSSDLPALKLMQWSIDHQIARQVPLATAHDGICVGCGAASAPIVRFRWATWEVSAGALWGRLPWLVAALAGVLVAAPWLDRAAASAVAAAASGPPSPRALRWLRRLLAPLGRTPLGVLVAAEAFVVLRTRPLWWWAAWPPLWAVQLFGPRQAVALAMLAGWTLLLDVFSRTALRDTEHRTLELVATAPGAQRRLLLARGALLVGLAGVAAAPGCLHEAFANPAMAASALVLGSSIALWGLASALLARSSRPFELVFLVVAYATSQGLCWLDAAAVGAAVPLVHLAGIGIALALLGVGLRRGRG